MLCKNIELLLISLYFAREMGAEINGITVYKAKTELVQFLCLTPLTEMKLQTMMEPALFYRWLMLLDRHYQLKRYHFCGQVGEKCEQIMFCDKMLVTKCLKIRIKLVLC